MKSGTKDITLWRSNHNAVLFNFLWWMGPCRCVRWEQH